MPDNRALTDEDKVQIEEMIREAIKYTGTKKIIEILDEIDSSLKVICLFMFFMLGCLAKIALK